MSPCRLFPLLSLGLAVIGSRSVAAQEQRSGATITGVVRDSALRPVSGADVYTRPAGRRTRTDTTGRFMLTGLGSGSYTVTARKIGYAPAFWEVSLSEAGTVEIKLVLSKRLTVLDPVRVTASRACNPFGYDGFFCRRQSGRGLFLDDSDIDGKEVNYTADLFRDIPGFTVTVRPTRTGPMRVPAMSNGVGCLTPLVDGYPVSRARQVPELPYNLVAVEVYAVPDSVPSEYQRATWPEMGLERSGRCGVIVYWTVSEAMRR